MSVERGLRPTSPVHVHVEDDVPVHVHVKTKTKTKKSTSKVCKNTIHHDTCICTIVCLCQSPPSPC